MELIDVLIEKRAAAQAALEELLKAPTEEKRDLNEEEAQRFSSLRSDIESYDARVAELREYVAQSEVAAKAAAEMTTSLVRVKAEPPVYGFRGAPSFVSDAYRAQFVGDSQAQARLARHNEMMLDTAYREFRDVGTAAFGALIPDQFLTSLYAPLARAGRPFANLCNRLTLPPSGMVFKIPRLTTGTAVASQATENTEAQETNLDETTLSVDVRTIAGQQDVSRQALERGEFSDDLVFGDLVGAYVTELDNQVLNGAGTSGTHLGVRQVTGINSVTYTDATPTVGEAYPKIADAVQQINTGRFLPPDLVVMHPRRWAWFMAAVDTQNRPLVVPAANMPMNAIGVGEADVYGQVVGQILGIPIITDANVATNLGAGTNEDIIIIVRRADMLLWELAGGVPFQLRFEQTLGGALTVKLVVYSYSAFTGGRYPEAIGTVGGTGLVTPTF